MSDPITIVGKYGNDFNFHFGFQLNDNALVLLLRDNLSYFTESSFSGKKEIQLERMIFISGLKYKEESGSFEVHLKSMKDFNRFIEILQMVYNFDNISYQKRFIKDIFDQMEK